MELFWLVLALLVVVAAFAAARRSRGYESVEEEPWRASLEDDEPLDMEAIARAEEEFNRDDVWEEGWEEEERWS